MTTAPSRKERAINYDVMKDAPSKRSHHYFEISAKLEMSGSASKKTCANVFVASKQERALTPASRYKIDACSPRKVKKTQR